MTSNLIQPRHEFYQTDTNLTISIFQKAALACDFKLVDKTLLSLQLRMGEGVVDVELLLEGEVTEDVKVRRIVDLISYGPLDLSHP